MKQTPLTDKDLLLAERMAWKMREGKADPIHGYNRVRSLLSSVQGSLDVLRLEVKELESQVRVKGKEKDGKQSTSGGDVRKPPSKGAKAPSKKRTKATPKRVANDADNT